MSRHLSGQTAQQHSGSKVPCDTVSEESDQNPLRYSSTDTQTCATVNNIRLRTIVSCTRSDSISLPYNQVWLPLSEMIRAAPVAPKNANLKRKTQKDHFPADVWSTLRHSTR
eukprot:1305316-Amphidinium_carterae.1